MDLDLMRDEVQAFSKSVGWYDRPRAFLELTALLHAEVVELDGSWMSHGFDSFISPEGGPDGFAEGLADVLINALDITGRFGLEIEPLLYKFTSTSVRAMIMELHARIADATEAWRKGGDEAVAGPVSVIIAAVQSLASRWTVNLEAAYRLKMDYNMKHRAGNKRA